MILLYMNNFNINGLAVKCFDSLQITKKLF
jgi:hypothetical protein